MCGADRRIKVTVPGFLSIAVLCLLSCPAPVLGSEHPRLSHNVVLVTLDGVRVQDLFGGLDEVVAAHDERKLYSDMAAMRARFGAATPGERRAKLMPQLWTRLAAQGVVLGNPAHGNHVRVQNDVYWSTPGYVEMLTGAPREEVVDNELRRSPNRTALEHARAELGLDFGQVAAIGSWDGFAHAASSSDDAFTMVGAYDDVPETLRTQEMLFLNELRRDVMGLWEEGSNDALTYRLAKAYLVKHRPRVLWLALVNSDDWAHADRYDRYLAYLHRADAMLGDLWTTLETLDTAPRANHVDRDDGPRPRPAGYGLGRARREHSRQRRRLAGGDRSRHAGRRRGHGARDPVPGTGGGHAIAGPGRRLPRPR